MNSLKSIIYVGCFLFPFVALSQTDHQVKKIEVAGEAETEVTPDEITSTNYPERICRRT